MFPHVCLQRRVCLQRLCGIICQLVDASDHRESCCFLVCVFKRLAVFVPKICPPALVLTVPIRPATAFPWAPQKAPGWSPYRSGSPVSTKEHLDLQQKCVDRGSTIINTWINFRDWQDWQDLKVKDWKSKGMVRFGGWKDWKGQGIRKDQSENPDETSSHLVIDSWNKRLAICQHLPCSWPPYRSHPQELFLHVSPSKSSEK